MPPSWSNDEVDSLIAMCAWIYRLANPGHGGGEDAEDNDDDNDEDDDEQDDDIRMKTLSPRARKFLIHCTDGYTESSLLALAYFMYAECLTTAEAWIKLHKQGRNFFAYPSDVTLLSTIQSQILQASPKRKGLTIPTTMPAPPSWLKRMDGSLPSRVLPYMYLGNLTHANNPDLLTELGITRVLSVGEPTTWTPKKRDAWGRDHLMLLNNVQDNGVDSLTNEFDRCLKFIGQSHSPFLPTLMLPPDPEVYQY